MLVKLRVFLPTRLSIRRFRLSDGVLAIVVRGVVPEANVLLPVETRDPVREHLADYFETTNGWLDKDRSALACRSSVNNNKTVVEK